MANNIKIGELAHRTDCQVETIRYYEREGLLPEPDRTGGNYRLYNDAHVERLLFIRHCRSLDMTQDEIRTLLKLRDAPNENCEQVNILLDEHIVHIGSRIADLKILEKHLKKLRRQCDHAEVAKNCGILNDLASKAVRLAKAKKIKTDHVHGTHEQRRKK